MQPKVVLEAPNGHLSGETLWSLATSFVSLAMPIAKYQEEKRKQLKQRTTATTTTRTATTATTTTTRRMALGLPCHCTWTQQKSPWSTTLLPATGWTLERMTWHKGWTCLPQMAWLRTIYNCEMKSWYIWRLQRNLPSDHVLICPHAGQEVGRRSGVHRIRQAYVSKPLITWGC